MALIENKRKTDAERLIKCFPENPDIQVLNGRFGPYIVAGKKNVKIPKGEEPAELTLERCLELADATPDKPAKGGRFGKKAAPAKEEKDADAPAKKSRCHSQEAGGQKSRRPKSQPRPRSRRKKACRESKIIITHSVVRIRKARISRAFLLLNCS